MSELSELYIFVCSLFRKIKLMDLKGLVPNSRKVRVMLGRRVSTTLKYITTPTLTPQPPPPIM